MATGYSRQSSFIDGDIILAEHGNAEFNHLLQVFDTTTGHDHDGTEGGGTPVPFIQKETSGVYVDTTTPVDPKILFKVGGVTLNTTDSEYFTSSGLVKHTPSGGSAGPLNTFLDGLTTSISDTLVAANQYTDDAVASFVSGSGYVTTTRTINGYDLSADRVLNAADVGAAVADGTAIDDYSVFQPSGFYTGGSLAPTDAPSGIVSNRNTSIYAGNSTYGLQLFSQSNTTDPASENILAARRWRGGIPSGDWVTFYHTDNKPTADDVGAGGLATPNNWSALQTFDGGTVQVGSSAGTYRQFRYDGTISSDGTTFYPLYHTGNKPTAADVGALPLNQSFTYQNAEGRWRTPDNVTIEGALGSTNGLQVYQNGIGDALMTFHVGGDYAVHFGLDGSTDKLSVGGWSMGANSYAIYHEGNKPTAADVGAVDNSLLLNYNLDANAETTDDRGIQSYHLTGAGTPDGNGTQFSQAYNENYKTHLYHSWNNRIFARTQANNGNNNQEWSEVATQKTYVNAGTGVYSRLATNTHLLYYSGTNQTFSINDTTYRIGDKIYITKSIESAGEITVNFSAGGSMVLPDNVSYTSVTLNAVGTVCIEKYFGNSWLVRRA